MSRVRFLKLDLHNKSLLSQYHAALEAYVNSGSYVLGPNVEDFETHFAEYCNAKFAIGTSNCLDSLELLLLAHNLPEGSEVLVPSNTYIATWLAVLNCNLKVVPVEPNPYTHNVEIKNIKEACTDKTVAIIAVDLYGNPCDIQPIIEFARQNSLLVFQDCAQSHGAMYMGTKSGSLANASAFSFYPSKNLGALGDAGAIITNDAELASRLFTLRNYGSSKKYYNKYIGRNCRLDELQAAFLLLKLELLDSENSLRNTLAKHYIKILSVLSDYIFLPSLPLTQESSHAWHIFNILVHDRSALSDYLNRLGIDTMCHYPVPPHRQEALKPYKYLSTASLPISEYIHEHCISLPISGYHTVEEVSYVSDSILRYYEQNPDEVLHLPWK